MLDKNICIYLIAILFLIYLTTENLNCYESQTSEEIFSIFLSYISLEIVMFNRAHERFTKVLYKFSVAMYILFSVTRKHLAIIFWLFLLACYYVIVALLLLLNRLLLLLIF